LSMAYSIPDDVIEKVRERADIVEVVGEHIQLKQSGRNFKALCPFHPEKAPSFMVSAEKQIYHCFGCGAGGNVFSFLMQLEGMTFPEAVKALARKYGIEVPETLPRAGGETSFAFRINAMAAKVYHAALLGTKEGKGARKYLRARGVPEDVEKDFLLGHAPRAGNILLLEARRRKIDERKLAAMGLAVERDGVLRDLFRGRLIFPIASAGGRILGFGGRVLDEGSPKYLNSPETRLFKKSEALFGIHRAKGPLRTAGRGILVEGYMDVVGLHAQGLTNTVASLGTAFTFEQAARLRRYCSDTVLVYDGDSAGRVAALRACEPAVRAGLKVVVAQLPVGYDPDSFVKERGRDALERVIDAASYYIDYVFAQARADDVEEAVRYVLRLIAAIRDPIRASLDLKRLADRSGIPMAMLETSLKVAARESDPGVREHKRETITCDRIEKAVISILIGIPGSADRILGAVSPEDFEDRRMRRIFEAMLDRRSRNMAYDVSALVSTIEDEPTRKLLIDCSVNSDITGDPDRIVSDHISYLKKRVIQREIGDLRKQILAAEKEGDAELLKSLLSRRQSLADELRLLSA
jgi:DNA primase